MNNTTRLYFRTGSSSRQTKLLADEVVLYIYAATLVVGLIGNFLVVFSVASRRRRRRVTANDVFILNLAISDLMLLFIFIPFAIYIRLTAFRPTVFVCKFTAPIITVALGGTVYTLTAMALQRCLVITQPFRQECTVRRATIIIAIVWVFSIALSIPKIMIATPYRQRICIIRWQSPSQRQTYTVTLFVLRFAIPFCLIIISYVKMGIALLKTQAPRFAADSSGNIRDVTNRKENIEVIKTFVIISFLFFVLMLPYRLTRLMMIFGEKNKDLKNIYELAATLTIAHSCVNPIIYGTFMKKFSQDYKRVFVNVFCCRFLKSRQEDVTSGTHELDEVGDTSAKWKRPSSTNKTTEATLDSTFCRPEKSMEDSYLLSG